MALHHLSLVLQAWLLVLVTYVLVPYSQAAEVIPVHRFAVGSSARLHCEGSTSLGHVIQSGWWSATWRRVFDPNVETKMTSVASSAVRFENATADVVDPGAAGRREDNEFSVSLLMKSTIVIEDVTAQEADLYACVFADEKGKLLGSCFAMLVVGEKNMMQASADEQIRGLVQRQRPTVQVHSHASDPARLVCWQVVHEHGDQNQRGVWQSGGEAIGAGRNSNLPFQTILRQFDLVMDSVTVGQLRMHTLLVFPQPPQQNFTCVSRNESLPDLQTPVLSTYSVLVGGSSPSGVEAMKHSTMSMPEILLSANSSHDTLDHTLAKCYKSGPQHEAHNSLENSPTPVWYVNGDSSSSWTHLPKWARKSTCERSGQWISLEVHHGHVSPAVQLSCSLEYHTVAHGQPHCHVSVTSSNGNDIMLAEGPTDTNTNGTGDADDDGSVHVESLQSDGIIAVVILGVALLISVTTVITIYKRREHNIVIRRIRHRHRYLTSMPSDGNMSAM